MYKIKANVKNNILTVIEKIDDIERQTFIDLTDYTEVIITLSSLYLGKSTECTKIDIDCWADETITRSFYFFTDYGEKISDIDVDFKNFKLKEQNTKYPYTKYAFWL